MAKLIFIKCESLTRYGHQHGIQPSCACHQVLRVHILPLLNHRACVRVGTSRLQYDGHGQSTQTCIQGTPARKNEVSSLTLYFQFILS